MVHCYSNETRNIIISERNTTTAVATEIAPPKKCHATFLFQLSREMYSHLDYRTAEVRFKLMETYLIRTDQQVVGIKYTFATSCKRCTHTF